MTTEAAIQELEELRGIALNGDNLAPYKRRIKALYLQVCGKPLRECNCKNVLKDAIYEIYSLLRHKIKSSDKIMENSRLVMGVVIFWGGTHYTNKNLTDDIARQFLAKFPQRKDWFEKLPPAEAPKAVDAVAGEMPAKDTKTLSKVSNLLVIQLHQKRKKRRQNANRRRI